MVLVASLLLPLVALLLFAMDRVEDWMGSGAPPGEGHRAGRRGRHLRLVRDDEPTRATTEEASRPDQESAGERRAA
ncbi:hypothetical protein [Streptomyces sp. CA-253872]|uniref:hypothetical protein n=1 Tax=Streptomyces sp. CA-253872 TaxID=3240067 RepID=UPI003D8C5FCD